MGEFSKVFKHLRQAKGLSQESAAKCLGVSRSAVSMWEVGAREPDFDTLELIADFFNVDTDYLLGRTDKTTIVPESYYLNNEAKEYAEFLFNNPEYKVLFDASRKVKPEDIDFVRQMIDRMRGEMN